MDSSKKQHDALEKMLERMAKGETDPQVLAAMARTAKTVLSDLQNSIQGADKAKSDYNNRMKQLGPNLVDMKKKIDKISQDVGPINETLGFTEESLSADAQQAADEIKEKLREIPTQKYVDQLTTKTIQRLENSFSESLDERASEIPTLEAIRNAVSHRIEGKADELVERLGEKEESLVSDMNKGFAAVERATKDTQESVDELGMLLDEQCLLTAELRDRSTELIHQANSVENAIGAASRQSDANWNQFGQAFQAHSGAAATSDDVEKARDVLLMRVDGLPKIDQAQMGRIEATADASRDRLDGLGRDLSELPTRQECEDMLKRVSDVNRDEVVANVNWGIAQGRRESVDMTINALTRAHEKLAREGKAALQTTARNMTQYFQARTQELVEDKDQALGRLRAEYEEKLNAKDREIYLLEDSLSNARRVITTKDDVIAGLDGTRLQLVERLQQQKTSARVTELELRRQLGNEHGSLRTAEGLVKRLQTELRAREAEVERQTIEKDAALTDANLVRENVDDLKAEAETLSSRIQTLEQDEQEHLERISKLSRQQGLLGRETNEISGVFFNLAIQLEELVTKPIASVEGDVFVNHIAAQLLEPGSVSRLKAFVSEVKDTQLHCFVDVCQLNDPQPLAGKVCHRHDDKCSKIRVDCTRGLESKRVIYFKP
ncbi:hypothetical protein FSARC_13886 [Fusarium sarcochroum]|uniref:Uncharacterized protein n=1 Tax=Fusarium sarcochroum TaxID=1208366 RepID=A0A8H4WRX8_9HYPO|nr:hypothetical protein FSARC_13886 [Fusarium sarcochroum]